jgi:tetratricopeptide (TPR) repeat protein
MSALPMALANPKAPYPKPAPPKPDLSIFKDGDQKLSEENYPRAFIMYQEKLACLKRIYGQDTSTYLELLLAKIDSLLLTSKKLFDDLKYQQSTVILNKSKNLIKIHGSSEFVQRKIEILNQLSCNLRRTGRLNTVVDT